MKRENNGNNIFLNGGATLSFITFSDHLLVQGCLENLDQAVPSRTEVMISAPLSAQLVIGLWTSRIT